MSPEAHKPIIWVSHPFRQKLTILSSNVHSPIWVSRRSHWKLTVLFSDIWVSFSDIWVSRHSHCKLTILFSDIWVSGHSHWKSQSYFLISESLDTVTGSSQSYCLMSESLDTVTESPQFYYLISESLDTVTGSSQSYCLISESLDTVTGSSQSYFLISEFLNTVTGSSQSCRQKLRVPPILWVPHTSVAWVLCCSPTMSISSSSLSLCVTVLPNCEDDVGRLEKSTGPPATQRRAPLTYLSCKSDCSNARIFLYSFDCS
jgi:hypothetical protein